jgi:hypothetical protein
MAQMNEIRANNNKFTQHRDVKSVIKVNLHGKAVVILIAVKIILSEETWGLV